MTKQNTRLTGHGLWHEGRIWTGLRYSSCATGVGRCECGAQSPPLANATKRKQWHRDHKNDIRAGGDGIVWQGS